MSEKEKAVDLAVIGAGPGGYTAAFLAADLGLDVVLIDPEENPGGVCLYRGCIPSKTLLHAARQIHEAAEAEKWGVVFSKPAIDVAKLRSWKNDVVAQLTGGLGRLVSQRKIPTMRGKAVFENDTRLVVRSAEGGQTTLSFRHAVIATGSHTVTLPGMSDSDHRIVGSSRALDLEEVPDSLLIVGGGYIGLELGSVYAALGSSVTVVEMTAGLLPGVDRDLVSVLKKRLDTQFDDIVLNTRITDLNSRAEGVEVTLKPAEGEAERRLFGKVLVAVGRRPNTHGLGLENTAVIVDDKGFIKTDAQCRTTAPHIFAIGDVVGEPMLAHKASHEGRVAVEVISGSNAAFEPAAIPAVVFTDPEIAWAGLTEKKARENRLDVQVTRFPWAASGRAVTMGRTDGLTKLIVDNQTQRIVGVGLAGVGAGEMIAEGVLAMEMGANAADLKLAIHPHPTLTESIMEAAEMFFGTATHVYRPKRK